MFWFDEASHRRVTSRSEPSDSWRWEELPGEGPDTTPERAGGDPIPTSFGEPPDRWLEEERRAAFQEGLKQGRAEMEAELGTSLEALSSAISQVEARVRERGTGIEDRVEALALAVARVLLDREVRSDPARVIQLVRRAVAHFPPEEPLRVRMNPEDLSSLAQPVEGEGGPPIMTRGGPVQWEADPELERGDVVVEAPERILDGRIVPCLERIWEELRSDD